MRYATVVISPTDDPGQAEDYDEHYEGSGSANPREVWLDGTHVATQETIEYINLLDDGTVVVVAQFRGDPGRLEAIDDEYPGVLSCTVSEGETPLVSVRYEPNPAEQALLEVIDREAITVDWPAKMTPEGLRVTVLGTEPGLQTVFDADPPGASLRLERSGEYRADQDDPAQRLTDRQLEILRTGLELGYYEIPRTATQREIAEACDLSRGTVGEHLRRAEATLVRGVLTETVEQQ